MLDRLDRLNFIERIHDLCRLPYCVLARSEDG
jgi:hypothetical protein